MRKLLGALLQILLIAVLAVLTLGFGVLGLCSTLAAHGNDSMIGLLLIGAAVVFGMGVIKLARSVWRLIRGPKA